MSLPHEILGVSPDADLRAIKGAFRTLAKQWHPDRNRDLHANARFRQLVTAYRQLAHARTHHARPQRAPHPRPVPVSAQIAFDDELTWSDPTRMRLASGYSQRLWQIVVLGTVGAVALFWVSALISQL